jgi:RNA recognition motif-containing protein
VAEPPPAADDSKESKVVAQETTASSTDPSTTTDAAGTVVESSAGGGEGGNSNNNPKQRRVFVGNLAWDVSWQDLKDLMKSTGHEVTRSDIMSTSDGRSKGCGIVEFATAEGASQAVLTLNDTELHGRQIFVREDREDRGGSSGGGGGGNSGKPRSSHANNPPSSTTTHKSSSYNASASSADPTTQSKRVYVGNLSWEVTWQLLKDHMRGPDETLDVVHAEVITEHNGRSKGCGIVQYATDEEAQQAIATLTQTELKGRTIFVREDREVGGGGSGGGGGQQGNSSRGGNTSNNFSSPGGNAPPTNNASVYVWNLTYDTSWQDLKDHMRKAGNVDSATILTDSGDGSSIGCGIVVYQKPQEAQRAIRELQNTDLNGRPIRLREDRIGSGGGGRGAGGGGGGRTAGRFVGGRGRTGGRTGGGRGGNTSSEPSTPAPEGTQLYVGNLSYETTWRELKDHFKSVGEVDRADVKLSDNGRSKGFGVVRYTNKGDAETAIATLNGVELQGRALDVRLDSKA